MRYGILGSLEAEAEGRRLPAGTPSEQKVLAVLLLNANHVVPVSRLVDSLWDGEPPPTAAKQARNAVSRLRKLLAPGAATAAIATEGTGYRLPVAAGALDAALFEAQVARAGTAAGDPQAAEILRGALALWRGPALAGLTGQLIEAAAAAWNERRCAVMEMYYDRMLRLGRHREVVVDLTTQLAEHPLREKPAEKLMLALYRCGRRADALAVYARTRAQLSEHLGLDPGADLQRLHQQILTSDPGLLPALAAGHGRRAPVRTAPTGPAGAPGGPDGSLARPSCRPLTVIPRQLPAATRYFAGRSAELTDLDELLDQLRHSAQGSRASQDGASYSTGTVVISAIDGTAGIGKTALAIRWAHRVAGDFPDGQLYINLRGFHPAGIPVTPAEALRGFLEALGIPPQQVPASLDAQAALYRTLLAGKQVLIVLDNARDCGQVRPLLPGSASCLVLVTSRSQLTSLVVAEGAQPLTLGLMSQDDARELVAQRIGSQRAASEPAAVAELIGLCARLPLAVSIIAAQAAARPDLSLADLAASLRQAPDRLGTLGTGDPGTDARTVFSWSYQQLTGPAARMFRLLGVHCGPDISAPAAASLAGLPAEAAHAALAELTRAHLLTEHAPDRYACHDLLRAYAAEHAHACDGDKGRRDAIRRVLDHYVLTADAAVMLLTPTRPSLVPSSPSQEVRPEAIGDEHQAVAWFRAECQVLLAAIRQAGAGFEEHTWQLAWALGPFFCLCVSWPDWAATGRLALAAARRLGDLTGQACGHNSIGLASQRLGVHDAAGAHLRQAIALFMQAGNKVGAARAEFDLGFAVLERSGPDAAGAHFRRAGDWYRAAGHLAGEATVVSALGLCQARSGRPAAALSAFQRALPVHAATANRTIEAYTWHASAEAQDELGQHDAAIVSYQRALELFDRIGERYYTARALSGLGDTQHATGDDKAASITWQQSLSILRDLQHPDAQRIEDKLTRLCSPAAPHPAVHGCGAYRARG